MELSVREAASRLGVSENTIYRWVEERGLPAYRVNESYRFNAAELLEWANSNPVQPPQSLIEGAGEPPAAFTLAGALQAGGVHAGVRGPDAASVLRSVVAAMPLPTDVNRDLLLQMLLARESAGSTGIGDGVAIPHARNPIVMHLPHPLVCLCFLEQPIEFGAIDGKPVHTLFTIVSPTIKTHLALLSRLAFALRDKPFAKVVARRGALAEVLPHARRIDGLVAGSGRPKADPRP
ncbi:MAG TPA: PTS sugar transporter subunit IIA [Desulfobacterales bacterium]|jgi:PTS system nitrogen regulatory IIA component|nr:PTS sugar transporter subunit IIA [Desulfobacterales bacterium]